MNRYVNVGISKKLSHFTLLKNPNITKLRNTQTTYKLYNIHYVYAYIWVKRTYNIYFELCMTLSLLSLKLWKLNKMQETYTKKVPTSMFSIASSYPFKYVFFGLAAQYSLIVRVSVESKVEKFCAFSISGTDPASGKRLSKQNKKFHVIHFMHVGVFCVLCYYRRNEIFVQSAT